MALCLHCLHEARVAARERRYRIIMRTGAWGLSLAVVAIVGTASVNAAFRHPAPPPQPSRHARRAPTKVESPRPDSSPVTVAVAAPVVQQGAPTPVAAPVVDSTPAKAPVAPTMISVLPQGRTDLPDSVFAVRTGDTVVVYFDTSPLRTRRADKFELIVRQTFRAVYGDIADSLLAAVPVGKLAQPNELLTVLPTRGIHVAAPNGARVVLWPETRPGRDGPLVVSYRTTFER